MSKKQRIEFLIISSVIFAVSFISYFILTATTYDSLTVIKEYNIGYPLDAIVFSAIAGYLPTVVYYFIKLSAKFFEKRKLWFKIVAAVFFPITVIVGLVVSLFTTLPYGIYNIVKVASKSTKK